MKQHLYKLRIGRWRLYLSNVRLKKMNPSGLHKSQAYNKALAAARKRHYQKSGGCCNVCGKPIKYEDAQIHHVLPYAEFPQYGTNPRNLEMVCEECHHAVHMNPYANLQRMEAKAQELGFDLREYFEEKKSDLNNNSYGA